MKNIYGLGSILSRCVCPGSLLSSRNKHPSYGEKQKLIKNKNPWRIHNTSTPFPMSKTSSPWRDWQHWKENLLPTFVAQIVGWTIRARQASIGMRPLQQVIPRLCFATNPVCFHRYLSGVTDGHFRNCCLCNLSLTMPSLPLLLSSKQKGHFLTCPPCRYTSTLLTAGSQWNKTFLTRWRMLPCFHGLLHQWLIFLFFFKLVVKVWSKLPVNQFNTKVMVSLLITFSLKSRLRISLAESLNLNWIVGFGSVQLQRRG